MRDLDVQQQVGMLVAERPSRARVFERHGIDYCCGGKRTLADACREQGLEAASILSEIRVEDAQSSGNEVNPLEMTLTELADHIEQTHHVYLREELPRLEAMIEQVIEAHGEKHPWLEDVRVTFADLVADLEPHMLKEERILFPMLRQLEQTTAQRSSQAAGVADPIRVMEDEHDRASQALRRLRTLTGDFTPPADACNTFRAMLDGLAHLEADMHQHIHKENNVLFVRAGV